MIEQMVDGLFSVCVTLCTVPIIRCPKGNAAEAVARKLDAKIRQNLSDARNSLFTHESGKGQYSFCRPVLIILDRQIDLATSLHHTWTYQALAHDVLNYSMNKVTIVEKGSGESETSGKKTLAEKIQEDLEEYKTREDQIKKIKHELGLDEEDLLTGNTEKLTSAMSSLPELLEKKEINRYAHTSIATCILDHIKQRRLDVFFELEEKIMSKQTLNERALLDIFEDPEAGTPEDKIRLFLIYFLCSGEEVSDTEIEQYERILSELGCDITPFHYLKRWRTINQLHSSNFTQSTTTDYTGGGTKTISMFGKLMAQSSSFVMEEIMEARSGQHQDNYLYLDPKILKGSLKEISKTKNSFQEGIVFMVGGGNYIEYQNLMDSTQAKSGFTSVASNNVNLSAMAATAGVTSSIGNRRIIYGCSALTNASDTLRQLSLLGKEL
ncbi:SCFD1 [Lepeophtheirus salmonis]|uniref:SCFD1 n=1 Tax=Lepeophtheirus salmonis TaxID=72036 RepID=A0A7R8HAI1_LEPSM|nr:SCFD1 [Lepeophtheirus salmonis]CAF2971732.1 SCFD1 [Lepeophtheirus salmonis]